MTSLVEIDDELNEKIHRLAALGQTTPDRIVREAIAQYADRHDARQAFLSEADASWEAYRRDGLHLSGDEVSAWLKTVGTDDESEMPECHG